MVTSPLYDVLDHTNHTFSESYWSKDIKTNITKCLMHKYTNTNTQIHKYSIWRSARKTQHVVYFWKEDCSRISKIIFPCAERTNTKIQIQNTQIHKYSIWQRQHMSSSNMINAESPQFTQSSLAPSLSVFIFCPNVKNINWGELLSLKTGCWNTRCNLKKMWGFLLKFKFSGTHGVF